MSDVNVILLPHGIQMHGDYRIRIPKTHEWFTNAKRYSNTVGLPFCKALREVVERRFDVENMKALRVIVPPYQDFFEVVVQNSGLSPRMVALMDPEELLEDRRFLAERVVNSAFNVAEDAMESQLKRDRMKTLWVKLRAEERLSLVAQVVFEHALTVQCSC
jgi:hypothetical protein